MTADTTTRVLVVDDDAGLADLFTAYLDAEYDVLTATSGPQALQLCDSSVNIVLLDRRMPEMSGDEILTELRQRGLDCRVEMLSAVEPDADIVDMPFDDYMVKPVERDELLSFVEVLCERATYDERSQEFFSLSSKKAALETAGNNDTENYDALVEQMEALRSDIDDVLEDLSAVD